MKNIVDVVIVTYNTYNKTEDCVKSLLEDNYQDKNIICVDNCSPDKPDYKNFKTKFSSYPNIRFIETQKNNGYGAGCNIGASLGNSKYVVFMNNDVIVHKNWLEELLSTVESETSIAAVQPKILNLEKRSHFDYAGASGGFMDTFGYPFCKGRVFFSIEEDIGQYEESSDIFWASGACFLINRSVFETLGKFDESFYMYVEENDLCWRVWNHGYKIRSSPKALVYHEGMATVSKSFDSTGKVYYLHRNYLYMMLKNLSVTGLLKIIPIRILLDATAVIYYLFKYRYNCASVVKAYLYILTHLGEIANSRKNVKVKSDPNSTYPIHRGSVLWDYFILGKTKFSDIYDEHN